MLLYIFGGLAVVVIAVLLVAATRPGTFRIARTVTIRATPDELYPLIEEPRAHEQWSPFVRRDPAMQKIYVGPVRGVGAALDFDGGNKSGAGRFTVTGVTPPRAVTMRLQMTKPMSCDNLVEFTLEPKGAETTDVTWAMSGGRPFFAKVMCLAIDMDDMCGRDFLDGLNRLKGIVEGETHPAASTAATAPVYAGAHAS